MRGFAVATHFGMSKSRPYWDVDTLLPKMKQLGVSCIRDGVSWPSVEKVKGQYAVGQSDRRWIDAVTKAGIKVVFVFVSANKLYENPLDLDAFAAAAGYMAGQFKDNPNVVAFEIWNEPSNFFFKKQYGGEWNGAKDSAWLTKFAELVQKSSAAVRQANPSIQIIAGGGVTPATYYMLRKYPQAFQNIDGLVEHPYTYRQPPEVLGFGGEAFNQRDGVNTADDKHTMTSLLKMQADESENTLGRRLPVWVTEFGYPTFTKQQKNSIYAGFTETAQAAYHVRGLIQGLGSGASLWAVYDLIDDGTAVSDAEQNFGLVRHSDASPKPAFMSLQRVARLLGADWSLLRPEQTSLAIDDKSADKNTEEWAQPVEDKAADLGPQVYSFKTAVDVVTFAWAAGRMNMEFNPPLGDVTLVTADEFKSAECIDLLTGKSKKLKIEKTATGVKARGVPVGSVPVAIKWVKN